MRDHRDLTAFKLADRLTKLVYTITRDWPREEMFGLTSQMRRGAVSVVSNIVEGSARDTEADYRRCLVIAHSACRELEYQISLAEFLKYPVEAVDQSLKKLADETSRVLAGLIKSKSA